MLGGSIMYVKNISQLLKEQLPLKLKLSEGNSVYAKVIFQDGKNGLIKLYDGTIIPSVFHTDNPMSGDRFLKFAIEQFTDDGLVLKLIPNTKDGLGEDSVKDILMKLNITKEEGSKIINSLIKFNLPATDENIMTIHKNMTFLDKLPKMTDNDILEFLKSYSGGNITNESKEFILAKDMITKLSKIDMNFLSFLIENDIPNDLENMLKSSSFLGNKFGVNNELNNIKNILEIENPTLTPNSLKALTQELLSKPELLPIFKDYIDGNLSPQSENFYVAEKNLDKLTQMSSKYLSQLIETEIPEIVDSVISNLNASRVSDEIASANSNTLKTATDESFEITIMDQIHSEAVDNQIELKQENDFINNEKSTSSTVEEKSSIDENKANAGTVVNTTKQNDSSEIEAILKNKNTLDALITGIKTSLNDKQPLISKEINTTIIRELTDNSENLTLLKKYFEGELASNSQEYNKAKEVYTQLVKENSEIISQKLKEELPELLNSILKDKFTPTIKLDFDKMIDFLKGKIETEKKDYSVVNLKNIIKDFISKPELLNKLPETVISKFSDSVDTLKQLCNNYNLYYFNSYNHDTIYKNSIIIKNKYKGNGNINADDVKVFITVDAPKVGTVEAYLYKKNSTLSISLKTDKNFVSLFKRNLDNLNTILNSKGFKVVNISIEEINPDTNIVALSDFFNDTIFKELDVRV